VRSSSARNGGLIPPHRPLTGEMHHRLGHPRRSAIRHPWWALLVLVVACASSAKQAEFGRPLTETARMKAMKEPCELLQAIARALRSPSGGVKAKVGWSISFQTDGCCQELSKVDLRSALVGFELLPQPDLIGWNSKCGNGIGGPSVAPNEDVRFHYLELSEKDAGTLEFDLTPASRYFDANGNKTNEVLQGCPDVRGLARFDAGGGL